PAPARSSWPAHAGLAAIRRGRAAHLCGRVDRLQPSVTADGVRSARAREDNQTDDAECSHGSSMSRSINSLARLAFFPYGLRQAATVVATRRAAGGAPASRWAAANAPVSRAAAAPRRTLQLA